MLLSQGFFATFFIDSACFIILSLSFILLEFRHPLLKSVKAGLKAEKDRDSP